MKKQVILPGGFPAPALPYLLVRGSLLILYALYRVISVFLWHSGGGGGHMLAVRLVAALLLGVMICVSVRLRFRLPPSRAAVLFDGLSLLCLLAAWRWFLLYSVGNVELYCVVVASTLFCVVDGALALRPTSAA